MSQGFVNPQTITLPVPVADGGTGRATATAYAVLCGGTTSTGAHQSIASVGTSGQVLTSNGAGALPTFQNAATITNWTAYTPTFTGFGTVTNVNVYSRRVGDTIEIMGTCTLGTPTATEARISMGYNGTNDNITSSSSIITTISNAGNFLQPDNATVTFYTMIESNVKYITISRQSGTSGALTKVNGNQFSASINISFNAKVPIASFP